MNLSKNFTLEEMIDSETAVKNNYTEQFSPDQDVINNLKDLCINVLQPLRDKLNGKIVISSGWRCKRLNIAIKGKPTSQHLRGMAADCIYIEAGKQNNIKLYQTLIESGIVYDQCINEYGGKWIHISYNKSNNRKMNFKIG